MPAIVSLLPAPASASPGHIQSLGSCEAPDDSLGLSALSYSVPDTWVRSSRSSSGGGGGALDDFVEFQYTTETGPVTVAFEQEARDADGNLMVGDERWETFDYRIESSDGSVTNVAFAPAFEVGLGEQRVDVLVAAQAQAPEQLSSTRHVARVDVADLISYAGPANGLRRVSFVVSVQHDNETVELSDAQLSEIFGSVSMPDCTWDAVMVFEEVVHGIDVNNDGVIATFADLLPGDR